MRHMLVLTALSLALGCSNTLPKAPVTTMQRESLRETLAVDRCEALANRGEWEASRADGGLYQAEPVVDHGTFHTQPLSKTQPTSQRQSTPELGATPADSQALCARRGGRQTALRTGEGDAYYECAIDGVPVYRAHLAAGDDAFDAVKKFYAGADVASVRRAIEGNIGGADSLIVERGCQIWTWRREAVRVHLAAFAGRVAVTLRATPTHDAREAEEALIMNLQY
jgi:hypothetical protein